MLNNVADFGPPGTVGNGGDDRAAIQAAIDDAVAQHKGGVFFPAGTYRVGRAPGGPGGQGERWSLDLRGVSDFTMAGEGSASVVRLVDADADHRDWHVIILREGCRRIVLRDFVVDGNRAGLIDPDEQSHGIEIEPGCEDVLVSNCILRHCFGDGIRLLGAATPGGLVRRVRLEGCLFQENKRSGLGIQRALEQIVVAHCTFEATVSDQSIDFEPTGREAPIDLIIEGCLIRHTNRSPAVTLSGISGEEPVGRLVFSNNVVIGGPVFCTDIRQATIQGNIIVVAPGGDRNRIPLQVQRGGESLLIAGNLLVNTEPKTEAALSISEVNKRQVSRALIANNLCRTNAGHGIQVLSSDDVAVEGNLVVATGACVHGIMVRPEASAVDAISLRNNDITIEGAGTWESGIAIAATNPVGHLSIAANGVRGADIGIRFGGGDYRQTPLCANNRIDAGVARPLVGLANLPGGALLVGGAVSQGGGRSLIGEREPEGLVAGQIGDLYQRIGEAAGARLYVKEAGGDTSTGWVAK